MSYGARARARICTLRIGGESSGHQSGRSEMISNVNRAEEEELL